MQVAARELRAVIKAQDLHASDVRPVSFVITYSLTAGERRSAKSPRQCTKNDTTSSVSAVIDKC